MSEATTTTRQLLDAAFLEPARFSVPGSQLQFRAPSIMTLPMASAAGVDVFAREDYDTSDGSGFVAQMRGLACLQCVSNDPEDLLDAIHRLGPERFPEFAAKWAESVSFGEAAGAVAFSAMLVRMLKHIEVAAYYVDVNLDLYPDDDPPGLLDPSTFAIQIFVLAEKTGWSENYIRWELPLIRFVQYHLCIVRRTPGLWPFPASGRGADATAAEADVVDLDEPPPDEI